MRKHLLLFIFLFITSFTFAAGTYTTNSVLSTGSWYKVAVETSGIYKLTYEQIAAMGIGDPAGVRVYGYGGAILPEGMAELMKTPDDLPEVAIYMDKGSDGVFSEGDYILFYAQGPLADKVQSSGAPHVYTPNYYSKYGYYFITSTAGEAKKPATEEAVTESATVSFENTNAGYFIHNPQYNLLESGREWYGFKFQGSSNKHTLTLADTNINTSEEMRIDFSMVAHAAQATTFSVAFNGVDIGSTIRISSTTDASIAGKKVNTSMYFTNERTANPTLAFTYNYASTNDVGYIHYINFNYSKRMLLDGNNHTLLITNPKALSESTIAEYTIQGANQTTMVWNITNLANITSMPTSLNGGTLTFKDKHNSIKKYIAFSTTSASTFASPVMVGNINNQNLHALQVPDMVIISPAEYFDAASSLAQFHSRYDGLAVHIVSPGDIYNEFSSGTPDASAYRRFLKMFYDKSNGNGKFKYLLFMGTSSYDNRAITKQPLELLSYQSEESLASHDSYTTDDIYGMLEDNEPEYIPSGTMDIAVGRFPVTTQQEAYNVVNKTINYVASSSNGTWRALCSFLADNGDGSAHELQADALAEKVTRFNNSFKTDKIYLDAYPIQETTSGTTYPGARDRILDNLQQGTLLFTYVGHGSPNTMTTEQIINKNDIVAMYNKNQGLWVTATCDFSRYDNGIHSAGMEAILNQNGGAIALYTTTRVVYSSDNYKLMLAVYDYIIPTAMEEHKTLGEIFRLAKISLKTNTNKLNFSLLGDPAIKLKYPTHNVVTDEINGVAPEEANLQALGIATIKGHIEDIYGSKLSDYNGTLNITVYDKKENLKTLGQAGDTPFEYTDYPNKLFMGNVSVENGDFSFTFMVPKDINYNYGSGRILYYVSNNTEDGFGSNYDFIVGGSDPSATESEDGPSLQMYMNAPEFHSGDKVNSSPVLYVHLYDKWGINVVGAGIGHDLTATLTGPSAQSTILNNYYQANLNEYKSGVVKYQYKDLEAGKYTLYFKAWNLQNVSTAASLDFIVDNKVKPDIEEFSIYPNPATDHTTLYLRHNRPEVPISVTFTVYDIAWNEYWSTTVTESTDGVFSAYWDISGKFGAMGSGVYVVRAKITMEDGTYNYKNQKIIIKTQ